MQQAAPATLPFGQLFIKIFEVVTVSKVEHLVRKARPILTSRIPNHYFYLIVCVTIDELRNMFCVCRLIQDIAADHIVKLAKFPVIGFPVSGLVLDRNQAVTENIFIQKRPRTRMVITGSDIDPHAM